MKNFKLYAVICLAALLYTLGFPNIFNIYIPFASIIGTTIILKTLIERPNWKSRILYYLSYNLIITILSFYWITGTLQEFGKLPFIVAALMNGMYSFLLNPQFICMIFLIAVLEKYKGFKLENTLNSGFSSFIGAALFTSLEYFIPQQFPVMLGQPWIVLSDYLGLASYFGLPAFSFFSYLICFEIIHFWRRKKISKFNIITTILFIAINPLIPQKTFSTKTEFNVRLVQANISNFLKVESESGGYASTSQVLKRYKSLSDKPFKDDKKLDLIVWPETAYPYPVHTNKDDLTQSPVPIIFASIIQNTNANLLIGGYDHFRDNEDGSYYKTEYNSALYFNQEKLLTEVYHKHILIPFGETLPFGPLNKLASKALPEMAFFEEGKKHTVFNTNKEIKFMSSICYEILQPEFIRTYLNSISQRPHLMINLTNDSWYGNTVEPEQHLFLTRWRAIEFNLPILRSTNTGISTYIKSNGQELDRLEYDVEGNLDLSLKLENPDKNFRTFFQIFGFWGIFPIWVLFFLFHFLWIKLRYEKTN